MCFSFVKGHIATKNWDCALLFLINQPLYQYVPHVHFISWQLKIYRFSHFVVNPYEATDGWQYLLVSRSSILFFVYGVMQMWDISQMTALILFDLVNFCAILRKICICDTVKPVKPVVLYIMLNVSYLCFWFCESLFVKDTLPPKHWVMPFCSLLRINDVNNWHNNNTHLMALCPELPGWAGTKKVKPIWILLEQETLSGSGISLAIC